MSFQLKIRNTVRPTSVIVDDSPANNTSLANKSYVDTAISTAVANKAITLTGEVTGSGTSSFATTLSNTGVVAGTYNKITVDSKGRVTDAGNLQVFGDITGVYGSSADGIALTTTLSNTGVVAGTYSKVVVDTKGRITSGGLLSDTDITSALDYTPVNIAGDTMTGNLSVIGNPTEPEHVVNKAYIDSKIWLAIAVGY